LSEQTKIDESNLKTYFEMKQSIKNKKSILDSYKRKVKFDTVESISKKETFHLSKFISCFEFISNTNSQLSKTENDNLLNSLNDYSQLRYYQLKAGLNAQEKQMLSRFVFSSFLNTNIDFDQDLFKCFLKTTPLRKINLFVCLYFHLNSNLFFFKKKNLNF
jgi:hypothetical protein